MKVHAVLDSALSARVVARRPLVYTEGADARLDRPAHVRAASALVRLGSRTLIVQDDALWLADLDPAGHVHAVALPSGPDGLRLFGADRGNKRDKPDFEACASLPSEKGPLLALFGSGSTRRRERITLVGTEGPRIVEATAFYEALRGEVAFAGAELNIEGALLDGEEV